MLNTFIQRLAVLAAGALTVPAALAQTAPTTAPAASKPYRQTIGWVSIERLLSESKLAKTTEAKIEQEFAARDKQIQEQSAEFQRLSAELAKATTWDEGQRTKRVLLLNNLDIDIQRKRRNFQEDLIQRKNVARAEISSKAYALIQQIAPQQNLDIVLVNQSYFISDRVDITDLLLKALDQ
ncbi:OmpH family outer membrane protein [Rugamonas sp.]|uniref:OmpH family outer membrane protein n=1 Tax=Rugamonas sp. TaxID=1926287 RepID=UPI0025EEC518|nr:OmpH family outer membrane protein [Rugamonas sp.]